MTKILTIGGSGLVGSRINEILSQKYTITDFSRSTGVDITRPETLDKVMEKDHEILILYAAKTDVDACERDKPLAEKGEAYQLNVVGTQNVINIIKKSNKKVIYFSTDFVFNGQDTPKEGYTEESQPDPINWYGLTKYFGNQILANSGLPYIIARIAYPYKSTPPLLKGGKGDFVHAILSRLQNNQPVSAVTDHIFSPTFIDDIASGLDILIEKNQTGIFHLVGSQSLTPFEAANQIAKQFDCNTSLITPTTRAEFFHNRAPRPFNLTMNNAKIQKLGIKMRSFTEGLTEINK